MPVVSKGGYIFMVLVGRPPDETYVADLKDLERSMENARGKLALPKGSRVHRRGAYPNVSTGISYGGGSKVSPEPTLHRQRNSPGVHQQPGDLVVGNKNNKTLIKSLEDHRGMARIVGFVKRKSVRASGGPDRRRPTSEFRCLHWTDQPILDNLRTYAPRLSTFTKTILNLFETDNPSVQRHFKDHPMASTTFNFGPRTCTLPHKDLKNLSWGWCSVTSMGTYNPKEGGHLVLWDLKLAVEFPPYSTILIPSAILMHSNTSIGERETRLTITQYSSSGLYAWSAYGNAPKKGAKEVRSWWKKPRHMFSTMEEVGRMQRARR